MRVTRASPANAPGATMHTCRIRKLLPLRCGARMRRGLATAACCLLAAPSAAAEVKQAESVMPPGQSGFVSAPCLRRQRRHVTRTSQIRSRSSPTSSTRTRCSASPAPRRRPRPASGSSATSYGVPSVYGDTEDDMWWGTGYAIAQDRLFQIEAFRRATTGTLAEILGKGGARGRHRRPARLLHAGRARADGREPARRPPDALAGLRGRRQRLDRRGELGPEQDAGRVRRARGHARSRSQVHEMAAIGIYLARTTPSDDGEELANLEAFQAVGPKAFNRVFPLRTPGQWGTVPRSEGLFPSRPGTTRKQERRAFKRSSRYVKRLPLPRRRRPRRRGSATLARFFPDPRAARRCGRCASSATRGSSRARSSGFVMPERLVEIELHSPTPERARHDRRRRVPSSGSATTSTSPGA